MDTEKPNWLTVDLANAPDEELERCSDTVQSELYMRVCNRDVEMAQKAIELNVPELVIAAKVLIHGRYDDRLWRRGRVDSDRAVVEAVYPATNIAPAEFRQLVERLVAIKGFFNLASTFYLDNVEAEKLRRQLLGQYRFGPNLIDVCLIHGESVGDFNHKTHEFMTVEESIENESIELEGYGYDEEDGELDILAYDMDVEQRSDLSGIDAFYSELEAMGVEVHFLTEETADDLIAVEVASNELNGELIAEEAEPAVIPWEDIKQHWEDQDNVRLLDTDVRQDAQDNGQDISG